MLRYLVDVAVPLYDQLNKVLLVWSPACDLAFWGLKLMLVVTSVV